MKLPQPTISTYIPVAFIFVFAIIGYLRLPNEYLWTTRESEWFFSFYFFLLVAFLFLVTMQLSLKDNLRRKKLYFGQYVVFTAFFTIYLWEIGNPSSWGLITLFFGIPGVIILTSTNLFFFLREKIVSFNPSLASGSKSNLSRSLPYRIYKYLFIVAVIWLMVNLEIFDFRICNILFDIPYVCI